MKHTFAISAYGKSVYLEECIRSLLRQSVVSDIIMCTSTDNSHIRGLADKYKIKLYVREGLSGIAEDWNFAYSKADSELVTIAHQDDIYSKYYTKTLLEYKAKYKDMSLFCTSSISLINNKKVVYNLANVIKKILRLTLRKESLNHLEWVKRSSISLGNPIICPSCTYDKSLCGDDIFPTGYKFVLDWLTLLGLSGKKGRWICVERPLIVYRIHKESATKLCIDSDKRQEEEAKMFELLLPKLFAKVIQYFYRSAAYVYKK